MKRAGGLLPLVVALLGACSSTSGSVHSPAAVDLTVYAAASLKGVLGSVTTAYQSAVPGLTLTIATDSSSTLRAQIEQGAPADVFLSADESNPGKLVDAGLADGAAVAVAATTLVVIVPTANSAGIATPADLAGDGIKVIAAGAGVPITRYAMQAVANLASQPGYPAGFARSYDANVVSREDNVKAVVAKIELGEGDAAIVYATDATAAGDAVERIPLPGEADVPVTYAAVVLRDAPHPEAAARFLAWLAGVDGQAVLARFGFTAPAPR